LKKLSLLLMTAAALFAASPAPADDVDPRAFTFALLLVYDAGCAKLPPLVSYGIALELDDLPKATFQSATTKVQSELQRLGPTEFCASLKPRVDQTIAKWKQSQ
jgi:hypothetical protein